jgi:pyruvate dehydrogenase (quinone)
MRDPASRRLTVPPLHACDALVMLGTDFPYKQFLPTDCKIAQINIRPENLGRRCKLDLGLVRDVGATIEALLPKLAVKTDRPHLDASLAHYRKARAGLDELALGVQAASPGGRLYRCPATADSPC